MSICPIIDGAVLPTRQNGKTLPCANLAVENAKLRELCGELYRELYAARDEYWPASYLGDLEPGDVFPRYDELIELGVDA